ncbi:MAG: Rieske (2Fe-2S) protein [Gracilimonas sp.]|uniref:Rieske (2Fe-2S) protein n=1 Tax=Gracilimonas sp. TaxID=1974203 RepID=UPI003751B9BC|nr:Rieske (2Fe-2S) protein [Gracilimonas sp.]
MERKKFIKTCSYSCFGLMGAAFFLEGCSGPKYLNAELENEFLLVPLSAFEFEKKQEKKFRKYIVAYNSRLKYPVSIFRLSDMEYRALLMRCTHKGTELQVYGDRLQCPAHGSEFSQNGEVQNGPAETPLRTFLVHVGSTSLKIDMR